MRTLFATPHLYHETRDLLSHATPRRRALLASAAFLIPAAAAAQPTIHIGEPAVPRTAPSVQWVGGATPAAPARVALSVPDAPQPQAPAIEGLTWVETIPRVRMTALPVGPTAEAAALAIAAEQAATAPVPAASAAPSLGFQGLTYADNITFTGTSSVPPDPDMAVGPDHVIGVTNISIGGYDKTTGDVDGLPEQSLQNFFGSPTRTFDPKALYDQFDDRYLVVTLELVGTQTISSDNESRILLAGSPVGTPAGTWNAISIDAKITQGGSDYWCDYPGFAVDEEAIYVTCNYFNFPRSAFLGTRLYVIDKAALYAGTFDAGTDIFLYDPQGTISLVSTTMQPAQPHTDPGGSIGTWLSSFGGLSDGTSEYLQIIRIDDPLAGAGASFLGEQLNIGDICPGNQCGSYSAAPQQGGGTLLQTNDPRSLDSEWRNGGLWITATLNSNANSQAGQATAHWWRVQSSTLDGNGGLAPIVDQGDLDGEDIGPGTYTFFPSVSVNDGCAIVGYAAASADMFAGSYYSAIRLSDLTVGPAQTAKEGEGTYSAFDGSPYRWGDYAGTEVDFTSPGDNDFWTFNEYALPGGSQWGTWFAKDDCLGAIPVELMGFDATATDAGVDLAWQTASETANAGFDVERRADGGVYQRLAFVEGAGTTAATQTYRFRDEALPAGRYTYRLRQVDLDGTTTLSPEVEVFVGVSGAFALGDAFPNPATGRVQFSLAVQRAQTVTVALYDALGRKVADVFEGPVDAERAVEMRFDASGLPSGLYLYRAEGETFTATKSVTVIR